METKTNHEPVTPEINHAERALELLGVVGGADEATNAVLTALEALTHATLAQAQQQRTANLIAYVGDLDSGFYTAERAAVRAQVWKALGL